MKKLMVAAGLSVLFLISCLKSSDSRQEFEKIVNKQNEFRDLKNKEKLVDFQKYFNDGQAVNGVKMNVTGIGAVTIGSGALVACDPFYAGEDFTAPLVRDVPRGSHPVFIAVIDEKTAAYEKALFRKTKSGQEEEFFVDSGMGSVMDANTAKDFAAELAAFYKKNADGDYYSDTLAPLFAAHPEWAEYRLDNSKNNVFLFSSGLGDGLYASYWGLDEKGKVASFIIDLGLFTLEGTIFN